MDNITWSLVGKQTAQVKKVQCKLIPVQCRPSLFQALGQWGQLKSGRGTSGVYLPSFSTRPRSSHVARPHSISPNDREPGTG